MAMQNLMGDLALDDTILLLRRILKIAESLSNVDAGGRQRIVLDSIAAGLTLAAVTTVSTVSNVGTISGVDHRQFIDQSRIAYNTGIRQNLIFS